MKPGMQRDLLVAFWLLFDEFNIGDDCELPQPPPARDSTPPPSAADLQRRQAPKQNHSA